MDMDELNSSCYLESRALIERRSLRPFKSSEEYLYAMKEDLAEWLHILYELDIDADNFFEKLETGVVLCEHANNVCDWANRYRDSSSPAVPGDSSSSASTTSSTTTSSSSSSTITTNLSCSSSNNKGISVADRSWWDLNQCRLQYHSGATAGSFYARANVHSFVRWCSQRLCVAECLLFETEDLVSRKNERHVVLCLLEVARRGAQVGLPVPVLVQFEQQIERQLAAEARRQRQQLDSPQHLQEQEDQEQEEEEELSSMVYGPWQQIITNDLKSLDQMVRELVERCVCPSQFPMVRISEGKYRIGDTRTVIFVRVLRNHVMVRVGGGWDTLGHYLDKHDPCRCGPGHRGGSASKISIRYGPNNEAKLTRVSYDRSEGTGHSPRNSQCIQTPGRRHEEASGDSSSEVSDEGYRSQGYSRLNSAASREDRPESRLTHSSCDSNEVATDGKASTLDLVKFTEPTPVPTLQLASDIAHNTPVIVATEVTNQRPAGGDQPRKTDNRQCATVSKPRMSATLRSRRIQSNEPNQLETPPKSTDSATTMSNSLSQSALSRIDKNRTWSTGSMRRTRQRVALKPDTFRSDAKHAITSVGASRTTSMSPATSRRSSATPIVPTPLVRTGSALLDRLLDDPDTLNDDTRLLQRMHELVRQYRPLLDISADTNDAAMMARAVNPRRESPRSRSVGPSRIPAPVRPT